MKVLLAIAIPLLISCSTLKEQDEKGAFSPRVNFTVTSFSRVPEIKGTYRAAYDENDTDLVRSMGKVEKFLQSMGLQKKGGGPVDHFVKAGFETKSPLGGLSVGFINPWHHTMTLRGFSGDKLQWETKVTGPSEHERREEVMPWLLTAAKPWFGKNTKKPETVSLTKRDPALREFQDGE
ncbi:MAG: hypothetical protein HUU37_02570 [Bdellovibrionales bacterium]|nr:hypothetical protein [Bdellovibrionales bacterium]